MSTNNVKSGAYSDLRVLLLDDDPFQLEIIGDMLRDLGVSGITAVKSGVDALRAISDKKSDFQLMVCDLHMPGMDGFQFMEAAAQSGFKGALIIASGQSSEVMHSASLVARLRRFKLLGMLTKPVDSSALKDLLAQLR